ncbi:MAG: MarC family protein [Oscillatoriophycideae cyanobacterium NC_groundwater_1537_Pr4_S-0.65um_50_18]|nr:MarC family protein [Oscillatoriophycideae cyanobacterium NC_groundwater_1537_Pr4_S-0.65um_50_18]
MDVSVLTRTFIAVFVLADALGNAPVVLALTKGMDIDQRNRIVDRATLVATAVLLIFSYIGQTVLNYLEISIASLQIAGGLLLLLIALDMLRGELDEHTTEQGKDIAITPLALPLLAGPGTLTTVMLLVSKSPDAHLSVASGILGAMVVSWFIFRQANRVADFIGQEGAQIATKLLGFLLAALAVEIGSAGIRTLFLT